MRQPGNVYLSNLALTPTQRRFIVMLSTYSRLLPFWDIETSECDVDGLRSQLDSLSNDEQEMARFFVTVWQPENVLDFDIMQAIWTISDAHWQVIERWMATLERPEVALRMMPGQ